MVKYLRSNLKKINSTFVIEPLQSVRNRKKIKAGSLADSLNVGMYLITPLLSGVFLGLLLDSKLHTKPVCVLVGIVLGCVGSFFNLIKLVKQTSHNA